MNKSHLSDIWRLILSISICQIAGFIGSIFTTPQIPTWYASLKKPVFNPPNWIFGPVWITLFVLMGISLFLFWREGTSTPHLKAGLPIFALQLALNVLWSVVFFGLKSPLGGLIVIAALWIAILATIIQFSKVSEIASMLLIPYIMWVSFAAILNFMLYHMNH
jgi:benzodiazapine receptor